jgi:hypothetical protein
VIMVAVLSKSAHRGKVTIDNESNPWLISCLELRLAGMSISEGKHGISRWMEAGLLANEK